MNNTSGKVFFAGLLVALVLCLPNLFWRVGMERQERSALIFADMVDVQAMSGVGSMAQTDVENRLYEAGISGFVISEYTGQDLKDGNLGRWFGPVVTLPLDYASLVPYKTGSVLILDDSEVRDVELAFLRARFPSGEVLEDTGRVVFYFPYPTAELMGTAVLPDFRVLSRLSSGAIPVIYRPGEFRLGDEKTFVESLRLVLDRYKSIAAILPFGEVTSTYPNVRTLGNLIKEKGIFLIQAEFSTQVGLGSLIWASWPNVMSLHSISNEELVKRKISRATAMDRMFRASFERSVRMLYVRSDFLSVDSLSVDKYAADVKALRARLDDAGISRKWPALYGTPSGWMRLLAVLGFGLMLAALGLRMVERFVTRVGDISVVGKVILLAVGSVVLGFLSFKVGFFTKLTGGVGTALVATEASLWAMDNWRKPVRGILGAFVVVILSGLVVAAFFATPQYMTRLMTFSGVKLTLFLPIVIVLIYDLYSREHPESLGGIMKRPPLWSELFLIGIVMLGALVVLVRSGNSGLVPGLEAKMRDALESLLVARPRNKEVFIGYPALVIWYYLRRVDLWGRYREVLRLAVTLAFSSAINSFCHFHTPLWLTVLRDFNGLWTGLLLGVFWLLVLILLLNLYRRFGGAPEAQRR